MPLHSIQSGVTGDRKSACVVHTRLLKLGVLLLFVSVVIASASGVLAQTKNKNESAKKDSAKKDSAKKDESDKASNAKKNRKADANDDKQDSEKPVPGKVLTLREPIAGMALDYTSGDVAVTSPAGHLFVYRAKFLSGNATAVDGPVDVDPDSPVAFKAYGERMMLFVASSKKLMVLDAKLLKPFDSKGRFPSVIDIPDATPGNPMEPLAVISTSRVATDPNVFVATGGQPGGCLVNLATGGGALMFGAVSHPAMISPSGRFINQNGRINLRFPNTNVLPAIPNSAGPPLDPYDQVVPTAGGLLCIGTGKKLGDFKGRALCGLLKRPYIIAVDQTKLTFANRDTGELAAEIPLPSKFTGDHSRQGGYPGGMAGMPGSGQPANSSPVTAFDDSQSDRLIVGQNDVLWLLPLPALKLPNPPLLAARVALPVTITPGVPMSAAVRVLDKRVKASLIEGPEGATLKDGQLTWTPDPADLGMHEFILQYEADGKTSEHHLHAVVLGAGIPLSFPASSAALSDDGRYAAVWTSDQNQQMRVQKITPRLCTVDLHERRVLAERSFPRPITWVAVSSEQVFVRSGETTLDVLRLKDLAPIRTLGLTFGSARVEAFRNRALAIHGFRHAILQLPNLDEPGPMVSRLLGASGTFFRRRAGGRSVRHWSTGT